MKGRSPFMVAVAYSDVFVARLVPALLWLALAFPVLAASPSPTTAPGGDPRSSGQGPGLVGDPLFALLVVVAIGIGALVATLAYVRMTGPRPGA